VDGLAPARTLTRTALKPPGRFFFRVATSQDDTEIRSMLRATAFPGAVSLSLEREPDASLAASIEGDVHDTIVAREHGSARLVAMASRSVRDRFVNGEPMRVGYLGQLRIDPAYRRQRLLLDRGFEFCRGLHDRGSPRVYLSSVVADNAPARRLLERGLPGWPRFDTVDRLTTLAIPVRRGRRFDTGETAIESGACVEPGSLAQCLWRNYRRYQFAPCWNAEDLSGIGLRGLARGDFVVAVRGGAVIGCVACWDQRAFKQVVVRGYSPAFARWRPLINAAAPILGTITLPPIGHGLDFAYLSHLAVDDDDPAVLLALVNAACARARLAGRDCVAVGLSARGSLLGPLRKAFRHRAYESRLYVASWPDGDRIADSLDSRPAHPELATL
jgi:hypothetical protein